MTMYSAVRIPLVSNCAIYTRFIIVTLSFVVCAVLKKAQPN